MGQGLRSRVPGPPPISIPGSCISHPRSVFLQRAETVDTLPFWACAAPCTDTQEDGDTPTRMTEMLSLDFYPDSRPHMNKLKSLPSNVLSANSQAIMSYLQVAPHQSSCGGAGAGPYPDIGLSDSFLLPRLSPEDASSRRPSLVQSQCGSLSLTQNRLHHQPCGSLCSF